MNEPPGNTNAQKRNSRDEERRNSGQRKFSNERQDLTIRRTSQERKESALQKPFPIEDLEENSKSFHRMLECPACQDIARPPIYSCLGSHHMFCGECRNITCVCPLCNSQIGDQRCLFAEQCMEHLILACKYKEDGCNEILKGTEYRCHLHTCLYRPIDCFISKCDQRIPFKEYFQHMKTAHRGKINGVENSNNHVVEWWIEGDPTSCARWPPYYFTCFGNVFLYMAISTRHGMWEWAWVLASEEEAARFQVVAKVENVEKLAELQWKGAVHSIRKTVQEIVATGLCFVTNSKELRNPFLFKKGTDGQKPKYFWRTFVEINEITPPGPNSIPYLETTQDVVEPKENFPQKGVEGPNPEDLDSTPNANPPDGFNNEATTDEEQA